MVKFVMCFFYDSKNKIHGRTNEITPKKMFSQEQSSTQILGNISNINKVER